LTYFIYILSVLQRWSETVRRATTSATELSVKENRDSGKSTAAPQTTRLVILLVKTVFEDVSIWTGPWNYSAV